MILNKVKKMNELDKLKYMIEELEVDMTKFYVKGNRTASIRARKMSQEIKKQAQVIRMDISKTRKENGN